MPRIIDMQEGRRLLAAKRAFHNWTSRFHEDLGPDTLLGDLSLKTLSFLAQGRDSGAFYLYDLIMRLKNLGSGFEFHELDSKNKMAVMDIHLFLLDRIRFECMKRLGWLESYPGEDLALMDLVVQFDRLAPGLQARIPLLSPNHPEYPRFAEATAFDREGVIRRLIPRLVKKMGDYADIL
ncbi:MAG: hypothetical protein J7M32_04865 [Deltaproteobacteria bacterium]|nr:hypothetical protein [Deltaproteobacteria bacterium]OQX65897.1 MAG: hypothetical protein B5M55_02315 [Desulfococcus sp. 4484_242]